MASACAALLSLLSPFPSTPSFRRRRLDINALGSSIQRRLLQCNNGLYEYPVPRDVSGLVWRWCGCLEPRSDAGEEGRKGEREGGRRPRGLSDINTFHYCRQWPGEWASDSWWAPGRCATNSLLRSPASPSNLIHAAEGGSLEAWRRCAFLDATSLSIG